MGHPTAVPGFNGYFINIKGEVFSRWRNGPGSHCGLTNPLRKLITPINPDGYLVAGIKKTGGTFSTYFVHVLLLIAFVGPKPKGHVTRHLNGNPQDNDLTNIVWGTPKQNYEDALRHGTIGPGELSPRSKLTVRKVKEIREKYKGPNARGRKIGPTHLELSQEYGVCPSTIAWIIKGTFWKTELQEGE